MFRVQAPEREATWQIRTVDALSFTAPGLTTLRAWIREGRLHPDDEVSRTGKNWLRLGDMPEFSDVFRGFGGLPEVFVEMSADRTSAIEALGPPPTFGTEAEGTPVEAVVPAPSTLIALDNGGVPTAIDDDGSDIGSGEEHPLSISRPASGSLRPWQVGVPAEPVPEPPLPEPPPAAVPSPPAQAPPASAPPVAAAPPPGLLPPTDAGNTGIVRHVDVTDLLDDDDGDGFDDGFDDGLARDAAAPVALERPSPRVYPAARAAEEPPPASMLDAVTAHVRPITHPAVEVDPRSRDASRGKPAKDADDADDADPPSNEAAEASLRAAALEAATSGEESNPGLSRSARARRSPAPKPPAKSWPLYAGLGLLVGVAVVFGIPDVRTEVLGWAGIVVGEPAADAAPGLSQTRDRAALVIGGLDPAQVESFSAELSAEIASTTDPQTKARLQLIHTEVVAAVVFEARIRVGIAMRAAETLGKPVPSTSATPSEADEALELAMQALPAVAAQANDPEAAARAEVRAAVARGVVPKSMRALSEPLATELRLAGVAGPWIAAPEAQIPAGLISGLAELQTPSATSALLLSLAFWRAGDEIRALAEANTLLARVPAQPSGRALRAALSPVAAAGQPAAGEGGAADAGTPAPEQQDTEATESDGGTAAPPTTEAQGAGGEAEDPKPSGPAAPRLSTDQLISRGCDKVDGGDSKGGVELLKRAVERRPKDIDILNCLATGLARLGNSSSALKYYERGVKASPNFKPTLLGAAKMAAKLGRTGVAVGYYRRVLAIDSGHAKARAYVDKHGGAG